MLNQGTRLDRVFHALSDGSRRRMVERLCRGPASVTELAAPLEMSLPSVMQHLEVLEESGLVRSAKEGRVRTCRIEPSALEPAEGWLQERRQLWAQRLDSLGALLAEEADPAERKTRSARAAQTKKKPRTTKWKRGARR